MFTLRPQKRPLSYAERPFCPLRGQTFSLHHFLQHESLHLLPSVFSLDFSSTKHYFLYFYRLEKDSVQMAGNWTSAGLHITHFSMLYSRLVSKRSCLCLDNWKTMNKLFGKNTFLWLLIAMVLLGRLLPYRESYNSFFNLGSFIDWGIVVILLVQAATFVLFMSIWRWGDLLFL